MPSDDLYEVFDDLREEFRHKTQREFLAEIHELLESRPTLQSILSKRRRNPTHMAVTFDRRVNDAVFSYGYFDILLVVLDRLSGGSGIYKPVHQVRVLRWNASDAELLAILRAVAPRFPQTDYRRLLVMKFDMSSLQGHRIDRKIHRR